MPCKLTEVLCRLPRTLQRTKRGGEESSLLDLLNAADPRSGLTDGCHGFGRLRAAPIFSQSVEREAKKKERAKIGDEASGSEARKNEGLPV